MKSDPSLDQLNEAERRALLLLAEGHTIKSAASLMGTTPAAINERLREARRKTGAGSSRELARKLTAHKTRDRKIGIEQPQDVGLPGASRSPKVGWSRRSVTTMASVLLIVATAAAALVSQSQSDAKVDPIIGQALPDLATPSDWQGRLQAEVRDPSWASRSEAVLRDRYRMIAHVDGHRNPLRIRCGRSICEVAGTIDAALSEDHNGPLNQTMQALQAGSLVEGLKSQGLNFETALFLNTQSNPPQPAFFSYYTRLAP